MTQKWSNQELALHFGISETAVRKILKSKFEGSAEMRERQDTKARQKTAEIRSKFLKNPSSSHSLLTGKSDLNLDR